MILSYHPGTAVLLGGALLCVLAAALSWQRRTARGSVWFICAALSCIFWSVTEAIELNAGTMDQDIFWSKMSYFGIATLPVFWFLFALRYQEQTRLVQRQVLPLFFLVPIATIFAALTNEQHRLIWSSVTEAANGLRVYEHGPLFWVFVFYCYILLIAGTVLLVRGVLRQHDLYRQQAASILCGVFFPLVGNAIYLAGLTPVPGMDPTPFFFGISALWILMGLSERRLFDLSPIARDNLIENMSDGLLVLDKQNRVTDLNPAALAFLRLSAKETVGQQVETVLAPFSQILELCLSPAPAETTLTLSESPGRYWNFHTVPLQRGHEVVGKMLILRDITESKTVEIELRRLNERLQEQLTEINQLKDRLQEMADRDPLTNLFNRRYLLERLEALLADTDRPVSLIMVDVDHFKTINDRYGHLTGDAVLSAIAALFAQEVVESEFACRYGGEEFLIVLPGATIEEAAERGERLCNLFQTNPARINGQRIQATLSMGIAASPANGTDVASLLQSADAALYTAKRQGRNQVVAQPLFSLPSPTETLSTVTR